MGIMVIKCPKCNRKGSLVEFISYQQTQQPHSLPRMKATCGDASCGYEGKLLEFIREEFDEPLYMREFSWFPEFNFEIPEGFEDASWHNDAMPKFERELEHNGQKAFLTLWIDHPDPEKRENGSDSGQFHLTLYLDDRQEYIVECEDLNTIDEVKRRFPVFEAILKNAACAAFDKVNEAIAICQNVYNLPGDTASQNDEYNEIILKLTYNICKDIIFDIRKDLN